MRQSGLMSLVEAAANVVVGLVLAVAMQVVAFPLLGLQASLVQNVRLALIFTVVSIGRSFLLRRPFRDFDCRFDWLQPGWRRRPLLSASTGSDQASRLVAKWAADTTRTFAQAHLSLRFSGRETSDRAKQPTNGDRASD